MSRLVIMLQCPTEDISYWLHEILADIDEGETRGEYVCGEWYMSEDYPDENSEGGNGSGKAVLV